MALLGSATVRPGLRRAGLALSSAILAAAPANSLPKAARASAAEQIAAVARAGPPWSADSVNELARRLQGDPRRFYRDSGYRQRALEGLSRAFPADGPPLLREMLLYRFASDGEIPYDDLERLESDWGAVRRRSAERRERFAAGQWRFPADDAGRIEASIYSLPSDYLEIAPVEAFLQAVRESAPNRTTLAFVDPARRIELEAFSRDHRVVLLDTVGRDYTPWPRDTFSLLRGPAGAVRILVRPLAILQEDRRDDNAMGRELVKDLPDALDRAWGRPRWAVSPVPFHNGQVLQLPAAAWISIHTIEPRILQMLGARRVPVESFASPKGVSRYVGAARRAAAELSALYGRPVRFIHPLPGSEGARELSQLMGAVGGGAGFDLDSIVTLVSRGAKTEAFVGDVASGRDLLRSADEKDLDEFRRGFGLAGSASSLRTALVSYNESGRAAGLGRFLDLSAEHLRREGLSVKRLPLFLVPDEALADSSGRPRGASFSINWNNVVLEREGSGCRAEGFASFLRGGDEIARRAFEAAGCRLVLYPPLVASIVRNGGYRCASNHLRTEVESTP